MKEINHFRINVAVVLLVAISLSGCATSPKLVDGLLQFPEHKFSIGTPPAEWKVVDPKPPGIIIGWCKGNTPSRIAIMANQSNSYISPETAISLFKLVMIDALPKGMLQGYPSSSSGDASAIVDEEKEIHIEENIFHRIIFNLYATPVKGVSIRAKAVAYIIIKDKFFYAFMLTSFLGDYENDLEILEQIVRSLKL